MRIGTIRPIIRHKHLSLWLMATAILICPAAAGAGTRTASV
jgi:hypothetical protein